MRRELSQLDRSSFDVIMGILITENTGQRTHIQVILTVANFALSKVGILVVVVDRKIRDAGGGGGGGLAHEIQRHLSHNKNVPVVLCAQASRKMQSHSRTGFLLFWFCL